MTTGKTENALPYATRDHGGQYKCGLCDYTTRELNDAGASGEDQLDAWSEHSDAAHGRWRFQSTEQSERWRFKDEVVEAAKRLFMAYANEAQRPTAKVLTDVIIAVGDLEKFEADNAT